MKISVKIVGEQSCLGGKDHLQMTRQKIKETFDISLLAINAEHTVTTTLVNTKGASKGHKQAQSI